MKKAILIILAIAAVYLLAVGIGRANATQEKVNLCHRTGSESHPWEAINTADDHSGHEEDFPYLGPVKDNGKPTNAGNEWCAENAVVDEEPPVEEEPVEEPKEDISETVVPPVAETQIQVTESK